MFPSDAHWIISPHEPENAVELFERSFELCGLVCEAVLYVSARGVYSAELNGRRLGPGVLAPGWTSGSRLLYQRYDVTAHIQAKNRLSIGVARGWAADTLGWVPNTAI